MLTLIHMKIFVVISLGLLCMFLIILLNPNSLAAEEIPNSDKLSKIDDEKIKNEDNAAKELEKLSVSFEANYKWGFNIFRDLNRVSFVVETGLLLEIAEINEYLTNLTSKLSKYDYENFHDENLKRQFKVLIERESNVVDEDNYASRNAILLKSTTSESQIRLCFYENRTSCDLDDLQMREIIFNYVYDPKELEYYWVEYATKSAASQKDFNAFLKLYRKVAQKRNKKPSALLVIDYEDEDIFEKITAFVNQIRPFYTQLHAHIRYLLAKDYDNSTVSETEPIRDDVLQSFLLEVKGYNGYIEEPYPKKSFPNLTKVMEEKNYTYIKLIELADEFLISMNLTKAPEAFWYDIRSADTSPFCIPEPFYYYSKTGVGLFHCSFLGFRNLILTHKALGEVQLFLNARHLPLAYRRTAARGLPLSVGYATMLSAASPNYLEKIGLIKANEIDDEININRLYHLAVEIFFDIFSIFTAEKFRFDVLDENVGTNENNNCYLWELYQKYLGVQPPIKRSNTDFDGGIKLAIEPKLFPMRRIFSAILGFKYYESLCKKIGQYEEGNPNLPLNRCDFSGNKIAGDAIKKMTSLGASKPWQDVVKEITENANLDASSMLTYFEPLIKWLETENKKNRVHIGWENVDKCT